MAVVAVVVVVVMYAVGVVGYVMAGLDWVGGRSA